MAVFNSKLFCQSKTQLMIACLSMSGKDLQKQKHQQEAWLNLNATIAGIEIRQMTLQDYFVLRGIECPVLNGNEFAPEQLGVFCGSCHQSSNHVQKQGTNLQRKFMICICQLQSEMLRNTCRAHLH